MDQRRTSVSRKAAEGAKNANDKYIKFPYFAFCATFASLREKRVIRVVQYRSFADEKKTPHIPGSLTTRVLETMVLMSASGARFGPVMKKWISSRGRSPARKMWVSSSSSRLPWVMYPRR